MNDHTEKIEKELKDKDDLKINLSIYIRFWSYVVKKQLPSFVGYVVFLICMASLTPIFTLLWKEYIDVVTTEQDISYGLLLLFFYILTRLLLDLCYFFSMRFMDKINFSSWIVLDKAINGKAANIRGEYFEIPNVQNKINRAWEFNHGSYIRLYQLGLDSVRYITQTVGIFASLFIISPLICGIALISILPTFISKVVGDKISILSNMDLTDDENERNYYMNSIYDQSLIKEIILKNAFDFFQHKYEVKSEVIFNKKRNVEIKRIMLLSFEEAFRNVIIVFCVLLASYQIVIGAISLGSLASMIAIIVNLIYTLSNLVQNVGSVFTLTYSIKQFYEFMDLDILEKKSYNSIVKKKKIIIEFVNVSYRYPLTDKYVLRNLNLSISEGQHIAIVGANGSGKTTFVKLLLKLLEPSVGNIRINESNLNTIDCNEYWNIFSAVFQDFSKYKDSLRYNVSIADVLNMANDGKIKEALSKSGFNKDIDVDCMLSKEFGGIELSGGEWQKVALARAIFKSNDILILDEPTSAIDPIKETELYKQFAKMTKGKTCIFITHRLGSVLYSDLVLFFQHGGIAECGSHDELLAQKGEYYKFWNTQLSPYNKIYDKKNI